jgi:methyl-accepting chemotaxis protein
MAPKKSLNDQVEDAVDSVNEARGALETALVSRKDLIDVARKLRKAAVSLQKSLEHVSDVIDEITEAINSLDTELETQDELKLETHVDALENVTDTLEELSQLDLESE